MMGLGVIKRMNEAACERAREKRLVPYVVKNQNMKPPFPFPNFGDYRPQGWELIDEHFVDSSGFGRDDERALSVNQFREKLQAGHGYALIEQGEFQVFVGEFVRKEDSLRKAA